MNRVVIVGGGPGGYESALVAAQLGAEVTVVDTDGVTVVDALATPQQYEPFAAAAESLGLPIRRLVLTSSAVEHAGGSGRFKLAAVYGSQQASVHLDQEPNRATWDALYPDLAGSFDDVVTRPVSHIVRGDVQLHQFLGRPPGQPLGLVEAELELVERSRPRRGPVDLGGVGGRLVHHGGQPAAREVSAASRQASASGVTIPRQDSVISTLRSTFARTSSVCRKA